MRRASILAVYVALALGVYFLQGPSPPISIDHIAYFKLADQIRAAHEYMESSQMFGKIVVNP